MIPLSPDELRMVADDVGAVTEALMELHRHIVAGRSAPSPKFAKLAARWATRRNEEPSTVVRLTAQPAGVLDLAALALSDIETFLRDPPQ